MCTLEFSVTCYFCIQSGLGDLSAPNGKQLERGDRIALFLADKVLTAIGDADAAIPLYMSWAKTGSNPFIVSCSCYIVVSMQL